MMLPSPGVSRCFNTHTKHHLRLVVLITAEETCITTTLDLSSKESIRRSKDWPPEALCSALHTTRVYR